MANNPALQNAALMGGTGVATGRWLSSGVQADYIDIRNQLLLFAAAVDAAIGPTTVSADDASLMTEICASVISARWPTAAADYTALASAIAAMWAALRTGLSTQAADSYSISEDFDCNPQTGLINTTGQIFQAGKTSWFVVALSGSGNQTLTLGGSPQNNPNHPGICVMQTAATINNGLAIKRGQQINSSSQYCRSDILQRFSCWFAIPVVANIRCQIGIDGEPATQAIGEGAMLILDTSVSPFFQISAARSGQTVTAVTTVQPVASATGTPTWQKLDIIQNTQGVYQFFLNDVAIGTLDRSAVVFPPTTGTNVGAMVQALTGSSVQLQIDKIEVQSVPLNRAIN